MTGPSLAERLAQMPADRSRRYIDGLTDAAAAGLAHHWPFWARPGQIAPPGAWRIWLIMAGRGFGKTRAGAEWVRSIAEAQPEARIALVAANLAEARSVMVEGQSGLLAIAPDATRPHWEPSLLPLLFAGQAHKEITHNEALVLIDVLLCGCVEGVVSDPDSVEADEGKAWIIGPSPLGSWTGHATSIAISTAGGWRFAPPVIGMRVHDRVSGSMRIYDGSAWLAPAAIPDPVGGGTIDSEARLTLTTLLSALRGMGFLPVT